MIAITALPAGESAAILSDVRRRRRLIASLIRDITLEATPRPVTHSLRPLAYSDSRPLAFSFAWRQFASMGSVFAPALFPSAGFSASSRPFSSIRCASGVAPPTLGAVPISTTYTSADTPNPTNHA